MSSRGIIAEFPESFAKISIRDPSRSWSVSLALCLFRMNSIKNRFIYSAYQLFGELSFACSCIRQYHEFFLSDAGGFAMIICSITGRETYFAAAHLFYLTPTDRANIVEGDGVIEQLYVTNNVFDVFDVLAFL